MSQQEMLVRSTESEMSLVGAMLIDSRCIDQASASLMPDDFGDPLSRLAFTLLVNTRASGQVVDIREIIRSGKAKDVRYEAFIGKCAVEGVVHAVQSYIHEVRQFAILRALQSLSVVFSDRVSSPHQEAVEIQDHVTWLQSRIEQITLRQNDSEIQSIGAYANSAIKKIDESMQKRTQLGTSTGLETMDETLGGLFPGELTTIAARPGVGKTSLGIQIARSIALNGGRAVVFSLEMTGEELAQRSLCSMSDVCSQRLRNGVISRDEFERLAKTVPKLESCRMFVDDRSSRDINQIAAACRLLASEEPLSIVVVDYVGLVKPTATSRGRSRAEQVSEVMKGLKAIAKDLSCPVLALSQVNREAAKEGWLRLHHLKDSGSIEEDSNSVWFIQSDGQKVQIDVAKNRSGQIGVNDIDWNARHTTFKDIEARSFGNYEAEFSEFGTGLGF